MSMSCILCNANENIIKYNNMYFCNSCYIDNINKYNSYEESHIKPYEAPVKILDNLYIGSLNSVVNTNNLIELKINKIIIAGKLLKNKVHNKFEHIELLIDDSLEQDISNAISITNNFINSNMNDTILIHCYSGISRSGALLIGYIMKHFSMNYDTALNFVKNKYNKIHPNSNFENQLRNINFI